MERDVISERTKAGLEAARARGRHGGRPAPDKKKLEKARKMYESRDFSVKEIIETVGISQTTFYKYIPKRIEGKIVPPPKGEKKNDKQSRES